MADLPRLTLNMFKHFYIWNVSCVMKLILILSLENKIHDHEQALSE